MEKARSFSLGVFNTPKRQCACRGCIARVSHRMVMCPPHWNGLPEPMRRSIRGAFKTKDRLAARRGIAAATRFYRERPGVAMELFCPSCGAQHIDEGRWATKAHRTHKCQHCAHLWRPYDFNTTGVLRVTTVTQGPADLPGMFSKKEGE